MNTFAEWHQIAGVVGTFVYVSCYFLVQVGWVKAPGYLYCMLNMVAAGLVGVSLLYEFNLASALIQISWILISLVGIAKLGFGKRNSSRRRRRRKKSTSGRGHYSPEFEIS